MRILIIFLFSMSLFAQETKRPQSGTLTVPLATEPDSLHVLTSTDGYSSAVHSYGLEGLLGQNIDTEEWEPGLAEKWTISKDKKVFTFVLRENLKFSDGSPLTVEDVCFSFNAIKDVKYKAFTRRPYLDGVDKCEIVDNRTVKFTANNTYFLNFDVIAGGIVRIIPKKLYGDPNSKMNKTFIGSGPYKLETYEKGRRIILNKNPNWWGWKQANKNGEYNFERIQFRFVESGNVRMEMLKKGDIDYMDFVGAIDQFVNSTKGPEWGKSLIKVQTQNEGPKGFNWIGMNQRREIFKDVKVRTALVHLMNRDMMIEKFLYGLYEKTDYPGIEKEYRPSGVKSPNFDPKKALSLLKEAGWEDSDSNGVLDKVIDGKKIEFKFDIMIATDFWNKFLTVFKEDAKKIGVIINIKLVEWNTFSRLLKEGNFDALAMAWGGGGTQWDPKQIWHSSQVKGGSNYVAYNNPEVDKLIDEARNTWDRKKRASLLKKVNELIAKDVPYIFLWNIKYVLYAHRAEIKKPKDTFRYGVGTSFWWAEKK